MNHHKAPLLEALIKHRNEKVAPFHVPAHKHGRFKMQNFSELVGDAVMEIDLTFTRDLDGLHSPVGDILHAEQLAADAYGADHAYFLVNGTSCGVQAMIMAACRPGDKILVPRNVHKSVLSGLVFTGAIPVYIQPEHSGFWDFALQITPEAVEAAISEHPDARALFVVNPTYFGVAADLERIVNICHKKGLMVLADEAHGGNLYFHEDDAAHWPLSAMRAGADMSAISTHKTTGSMTQSSLLLLNETDALKKHGISAHDMRITLSLLHTTSPSYVLLASLDAARREMHFSGRAHVQKAIDFANYTKEQIRNIPRLKILEDDEVVGRGFKYEPTKLVFSGKELGLKGGIFKGELRDKHGIELEMSLFYNGLALFSVGDDQENVDRLVKGIKSVFAGHAAREIPKPPQMAVLPIPKCEMIPRVAHFIDKSRLEQIDFKDAIGRITAEVALAYPPGIPLVVPGERIDEGIYEYITAMLSNEYVMDFQGPEFKALEKIWVVRE
ncbi:MAG: aminotransferase class I/II-fold pyridoxal phosphate-dependent enzyme [Defluviitaleaceae bacterium]|nr:aminotransferase class I/II-fold pyridoxal phosphate-dependent enzyme [Defluviitaleaceae bacterium]